MAKKHKEYEEETKDFLRVDPLGEKGKMIIAQKKQVIERQKKEIKIAREKYRRVRESDEDDVAVGLDEEDGGAARMEEMDTERRLQAIEISKISQNYARSAANRKLREDDKAYNNLASKP